MNDIKDVKGTDNLIFKRNPLESLNPRILESFCAEGAYLVVFRFFWQEFTHFPYS